MTEFSLRPAWVVVNYHNSRAPHKAIIPVRSWTEPGAGGDYGFFLNWEDASIDADDMIQTYVELLQPIFTDETTFDSYIIYRQLTAEDIPEPVASNVIGVDGTVVGTVIPATQSTWTFRTVDLHHMKLVFLDVPVAADFSKVYPADLNAAGQALVAYVTDTANAFAGRDGSRPKDFISAAATLNEKLRRAYRFV